MVFSSSSIISCSLIRAYSRNFRACFRACRPPFGSRFSCFMMRLASLTVNFSQASLSISMASSMPCLFSMA